MSTVLGIGGFDHDGAVSLVRDGYVLGHVEWERVVRRRYAGLRTAGDVADLIAATGWDLADVSVIAWADRERYEDPGLVEVRAYLRQRFPETPIEVVEHHRCHLASAYYVSGFAAAAVLSVDGKGDGASAVIAVGRGAALEEVARQPSASSVGRTWHALAIACGYAHFGAAGKVMALGAYGQPRYLDALRDWTVLHEDGTFSFTAPGEPSQQGPTFRRADRKADFFLRAFDIRAVPPGQPPSRSHADLAASVQAWTHLVVGHMARTAVLRAGSRDLCMAGGVALNVATNRYLLDQGIAGALFVQPAAGDSGLSLGAALALCGSSAQAAAGRRRFDPYLGRSFSVEDIERALGPEATLDAARSEAPIHRAAEALRRGELIGWFQGREEAGPRALGARSLLADPTIRGQRDRIHQVKGREWFRPVALAVPARFFESAFTGPVCPYMLRSATVRRPWRERLAEGLHHDGSSRLQLIDEGSPPDLVALLGALETGGGVPALINTSLNARGEPLAGTPGDALALLREGHLDRLFMEGLEVWRRGEH